MPQGAWFYAVDGAEKGPVSPAELKALASSGQLRGDSLVWQEGMPNWVPAAQVSGLASLFAARPPATGNPLPPSGHATGASHPTIPPHASPAPAAAAEPALSITTAPTLSRFRAPKMPSLNLEIFSYCKSFAQPLLLLGLVLVLLAKGCDAIGNRYVARLQAISNSSQAQFDDKYEGDRMRYEKQIKALRAKKEDQDKDKSIKEINEKLDKLRKDRDEAREEMESGTWRFQKIAARDALANNQENGYFREIVFVFGTITLSLGLLVVGFTGDGAQRWISFVMLAIVTFSLYVGGIAWLASVAASMPRM